MVNTPATPPHGERAHEAAELHPGIMLRITHASGKRRQLHAVDACTTFGTRPDCSVQLSDSDVLPLHATLVQSGQHAVLRGHDIPLMVNDVETAEATLNVGDRFQLGSYSIEVLDFVPGRSAAIPAVATAPQRPPAAPTHQLSFARSFRPVARRSFRTDPFHGARGPVSYPEYPGTGESPEHAELFSRFDTLAEKLSEVASAFEADRSRVRDAAQLDAARQAQEQLERRVEELKQKAAELQAAVDESQQEARAEKQHGLQLAAELQKTRELLEAARADQENQKLSWENETAGLQLHLETMSAELAQTHARCTDFEAERADAQRRIGQLEADAHRLRLQLKRTSAEIEAATKQEKDARQKHQALKEELAAVREQLAKAEKERDAAQRDCKQQAAQLADQNARQRQLEQQVSEAAKELDQANARFAQTQARLAAVTGKLDDVTKQNAGLRDEQQKTEQRRRAEVERHAERLKTLTSERDAARDECRAAEKKSAEFSSHVEVLQAEVRRLNDQLTAGAQQLAEASEVQQRSQAVREELQDQLAKTKDELESSQSMMEELQQQLITANQELDETRARLQQAAEREATAVRDLESTKDQLADACEKIESLQSRPSLDPPPQPLSADPLDSREAAEDDEPDSAEVGCGRTAAIAHEDVRAGGEIPEHEANEREEFQSQTTDLAASPAWSIADEPAEDDSSTRELRLAEPDADVLSNQETDAAEETSQIEEPWSAAELDEQMGSAESSFEIDGETSVADEYPSSHQSQWDQEDEPTDWPVQQLEDSADPEDPHAATGLPEWYSAGPQNAVSQGDPASGEENASQDPWQRNAWQNDGWQDGAAQADAWQDGAAQEDAWQDNAAQADAWQEEAAQEDAWATTEETDEATVGDLDAESEPRFESSEEVMARLRRMVGGEAHAGDEEDEDLGAEMAGPVAHEQVAPESAAPLGAAEPAKAKAGKDDEADDESIESYMKRLLARVQGREDEEEPPAAVPPASHSAAAARHDDAVRQSEESADEDEISFVPRAAPEKTHDLAAMRELANTSARSAIRSSVRRRRWAAAGSKMAISLVALTTSCGLTIFSGFKFGFLVVLAGCFLTVAIVWGADAILTIQRMTRDASEKEK